MAASRRRAAASPSARCGWRTVVRAGSQNSLKAMSSKPITETSRGTSTPARRTAFMKPIAISSPEATIPVGRSAGGVRR